MQCRDSDELSGCDAKHMRCHASSVGHLRVCNSLRCGLHAQCPCGSAARRRAGALRRAGGARA
jgi:hypothetical protein